MAREYWLDLFTGKTWEEFLAAGANESGFRERKRKVCERVSPGDYLLCYVTGVSRFIAVLDVSSGLFMGQKPIWEGEDFPCRFQVKLLYKLDPKTAVPVSEMRDTLSVFQNLKSPKAWTGFFRGSPNRFARADGECIVEAIKQAIREPKEREFDDKKYWRHPKTYDTKVGRMVIREVTEPQAAKAKEVSHEEIQWLLLKLGSDLGLDVWVARNDRNKGFGGSNFRDMPNLRHDLPRQFDETTTKTVELIDVLWLQGDAIIAAFEVEHTSAVYSGLLRMADLVSMQPNIRINLYLVAPDERRDRVVNEINRPTFSRAPLRLPKVCKFIPYSELRREIDRLGDRTRYLKPEFIDEIAESCERQAG